MLDSLLSRWLDKGMNHRNVFFSILLLCAILPVPMQLQAAGARLEGKDWLDEPSFQKRWDMIRGYYDAYDVVVYGEIADIRESGGNRLMHLRLHRVYKGGMTEEQLLPVTLYGTRPHQTGDLGLFYLHRNEKGTIWAGDGDRIVSPYLASVEEKFFVKPNKDLIIFVEHDRSSSTCGDYYTTKKGAFSDLTYVRATLLHSVKTPRSYECSLIFKRDKIFKGDIAPLFSASFVSHGLEKDFSLCPSREGKEYVLFIEPVESLESLDPPEKADIRDVCEITNSDS